ncbi:hypothetical protein [Halococcus hamelinensis]|uniref:Uncharacterized protein n=1 Tax=Halococcus hamelinensis 100A6 TaxID=1132509 RepID=M0LTJ9_9EURY|nr:hypothetical protein [Halococcus hamelinensis]EMA36882.1 hypothetical protein C447_13492 [Halococcus hamelinensis 100A6]
MPTDTATAIDSTDTIDTESSDELTQLLQRVEALEAENDRLQAELDSVHKQHREDHHAVARENHDLRKSNEQLRERVDKTEVKDSHLLDDIIDLENQLTDLEASSSTSENQSQDTSARDTELTPIERVAKLGNEGTGIEVTPSIERAVAIYEHWDEWAKKTPRGHVLKDGLKTLLRTATGEKLAWRQVYRAAEALEELSKGRIKFFHHDRHGKMFLEPPLETEHECHSSSVATKETPSANQL